MKKQKHAIGIATQGAWSPVLQKQKFVKYDLRKLVHVADAVHESE